jgi:RNA polymerase sigma factor (sigma-70 family)
MVTERLPATAPTHGDRDPERQERITGLVAAARAGQDDAVGELAVELSPLLWHVARSTGLGTADAEDTVQTVWLKLLSHLDGIHTPGALTAWLVTTTRREAWRLSAARRRQVPADQDWMATIPDPQPGCEDQMVADEQRRKLWDALGQLSPRCRELLRIVAFVPRPDYSAVAAQLGMPLGSIGPTRGRCLAKLRAILPGSEEGTTR